MLRPPTPAEIESMREANEARRLENARTYPVPRPPYVPSLADEVRRLADPATRCNTRLVLVDMSGIGLGWRLEGPAGNSVSIHALFPKALLRVASDFATGTPEHPDVPQIRLNDLFKLVAWCP